MNVRTRFGKAYDGYWWGVWQDGRLVAFGAAYRDKRRCFKHQDKAKKRAASEEMPEVKCEHAAVCLYD